MPTRRPAKRQKKSFSLSEESLAYVARLAADYGSQSEALDELIKRSKREAERRRIAAGITNYYDSLGKEEIEQDRAWGQFAESQFSED